MKASNTPRKSACAAALILCFISIIQLHAVYAMPEIESVPVERLIANLGRLAALEPEDAQIRFNLARVHAMAFALKMKPSDTVRIVRGRESAGINFGPEADNIPFRAISSTDAAAVQAAGEHLAKAIELYRQGVELDPGNLVAKLGYAWCLDQAGDAPRAVTAYRHVIAEAWAREQRTILPLPNTPGVPVRAAVFPGFRSLTVEAAGYLIALLDGNKDSEEIATLRERIAAYNSLGRGVTPILVPLRDGLTVSEMVDDAARVPFDADGSGTRLEWTWISPEAGWLVYVPKGSRRVSSALQLFGNVTFWLFWDNGYQAMRALDDDADGKLEGGELESLAIWRDANSNGVSEHGEVKSLAAWEIHSLSWKHQATPERDDYAAFSPFGVTFEDGGTRPTYDVLLYAKQK